MSNNPIIWADFPDPDVIRVDDTYYMVSTTMHMMPGCAILRSFDLINWEFVTYVFDRLEDTPEQALEGTRNIYGKGMWAASLRYHQGTYYICFVANDTHKTYLYTSTKIEGPWEKHIIKGFYHDNSLLFDEDGCVYIVYGNTEIYITQLNEELDGPRENGMHRCIIRDTEPHYLGFEGAHIYKINNRYFIFLIHIAKTGHQRRTQVCFWADSLEEEFVRVELLDDDMGYFNAGVAQGGIVDTPTGEWYSMLFQDHGAVGRIPVLIPMKWADGLPKVDNDGKVPRTVSTTSTRPEHRYTPLVGSDDFSYEKEAYGERRLKHFWQWNHLPDKRLWSITDKPGVYQITTGKLCPNIHYAVNTLTQRTFGPMCAAEVSLDGSALKEGDYAGLCLLIGTYGFIAMTREADKYYLVIRVNPPKEEGIFENMITLEPGVEMAKISLEIPQTRLKAICNFIDNEDTVTFYYLHQDEWHILGKPHHMYYKLDHFMGSRIGLFHYATSLIGGTSDFSKFKYEIIKERN